MAEEERASGGVEGEKGGANWRESGSDSGGGGSSTGGRGEAEEGQDGRGWRWRRRRAAEKVVEHMSR